MPNSDIAALKQSSARLRSWLVDAALPFWAEHGVDSKGGFFEDLDLNRKPKRELVRRLRVQARQIYVYAHAQKLGWYPGQAVADRTLNFMLEQGYEVNGRQGFAHLLKANYRVHDERRDLYDHAFYLLALGWHGSELSHNLVREVIGFLDKRLKANTGYQEGLPLTLPRRQNPHMHLFEAMMSLYDTMGDTEYLNRAAKIYAMFETVIFDSKHNVVREFFGRDWSVAAPPQGDSVEPGHSAEWIWLLRSYQTRTGIDTRRYADALYRKILEGSEGWLVDERHVDGTVIRGSRRLWVQTELIKAHLAQAEYGHPGSALMAAAALDGLMSEYLQPDGTWIDQFDESGQPCAKAIPTSTFYHIFCAIAEANRVAAKLESSYGA